MRQTTLATPAMRQTPLERHEVPRLRYGVRSAWVGKRGSRGKTWESHAFPHSFWAHTDTLGGDALKAAKAVSRAPAQGAGAEARLWRP